MFHLFAQAAAAAATPPAATTLDLGQLGTLLATLAGAAATAAVTVLFSRLTNWLTGHNGTGVPPAPPAAAGS